MSAAPGGEGQSVPRDGIVPRGRVYSLADPQELLKLDEAARLLRVSKKTLRRRIAGGELEVVRDRRLVLVPRASVVDYVSRHTVRRMRSNPSHTRQPQPSPAARAPLSAPKLWDLVVPG